jgi:hypothetical protein
VRIGRFSHTTVVAYIALFAALSGSAIAISRNSVKGKHIAKNAVRAKQIATNAVGTAEIANGAVTNPKLATNAVSATKIAGGAVTNAKLAGDAVDAAKILDDSLSDDELAASAQFNGAAADGDLDGTYPDPTLEADSVAAAEIAGGAVGVSEHASALPAGGLTHAGAQEMPGDGSFNVLDFDDERYDQGGTHFTNNAIDHILSAPVNGIYLITAAVRWESNTTGFRNIVIDKNNGTSLAQQDIPASGLTHQTISTVAALAAGDDITIDVRQTSGGNLDVLKAGEQSPEFTLTWLAPGPVLP